MSITTPRSAKKKERNDIKKLKWNQNIINREWAREIVISE